PSRRTFTFAAVLFGLFGVLLTLAGASQAAEGWRVSSATGRAEGTVVRQQTSLSTDSDTGRRTTMYSAVVSYEVDGRSYEAVQQVASGSPTYALGERVQVA